MKKSIVSILLALSMFVLPACEGGDLSGLLPGSGSQSGTESGSTGGFGGDSEHVDVNNDGVCDDCKASVLVTFDFYAINDLHGKFSDTSEQPGVDEMTTYLKQAKAKNENTVILSSGDMWQGAPESNLTRGALIVDWMNEMDFVSMTLGNHEYDWGEEAIEANAKIAEFPFLAINAYDRATNQRVDYCEASVMVEKNGAKIGIIGAIGDVYSSISAYMVEDVYFKTGDELTDLVKEEAQRLRAAGADCIVYSLHDGTNSDYDHYDDSLSGGYVDLVFEGHTHAAYKQTDSYGVYHLQGGGNNWTGLSHATVNVNIARSSASVNGAGTIYHDTYQKLADDPVVESLKTKYAEAIAPAYEELGENDKIRSGNEIRQICAQLYYDAAMEKWGDKYAIVLGGGYMSVRSPGELHKGTIIYGELMDILPFDNPLVLCKISGMKLQSQFFQSTSKDYFIAYGSYGEEVKNNISPNATYYIVTDTYSSQYKPNGLTVVEYYDQTTFARDLLAQYVREDGLTTPPVDATIPEIIAVGNGLTENGETATRYRVSGEIIGIDSLKYGNMTIKDGNGNTLYVYGTYDTKGNLYENMENPPQIGDTVTLIGTVKNYVNKDGTVRKIELMNATVAAQIAGDGGNDGGENEPETPVQTLTIEEAIAKGLSMGHNVYTEELYYIEGVISDISNVQYGNFNIKDGAGNKLYVRGLEGYSAMSPRPNIGDHVKVLAKVGSYNQKAQLSEATLVALTAVDWSKAEEIDIAAALELGNGLADNGETALKYLVTGTIISIDTVQAGKTNYGNMTISDGNGNTLYVYGTYDREGVLYGSMSNPPQIGDTVTLGGVLKKYVNASNVVKVELMSAIIFSHTEKGEDGNV